MPVSPQDFELYSRMTGAPMPSDAMSRMQMAPDVYNFTKNFARKPNLLEKTGNLVKTVGKIGLMGLGEGYRQSQANEQRALEEQLRNKADVMQSEAVTMENPVEEVASDPLTSSEKAEIAKQKTADLRHSQKMEQMAVAKKDALDLLAAKVKTVQQPTTSDAFGQDLIENQTADNVIDKKMEQGSQMADTVPNVAEVLSESQDSAPVDVSFPVGDARRNMRPVEEIEKNLQDDMETAGLTRIGGPEGGVGKNQLAKFLSQKGLDQALLGAVGERMTPEPRIGDSSPLIDHPDLPGGEDDINLPSGTNTSSTTNLEDHYGDMRRMEAQERIKRKSPSEKQIDLLEQRAIDNQEAIDSGFMNLDDAGRKKESIRLGSKFGIPNSTDMAEIRKDPEFIAAQESMKPKSTAEKTDDYLKQVMEDLNDPDAMMDKPEISYKTSRAGRQEVGLTQGGDYFEVYKNNPQKTYITRLEPTESEAFEAMAGSEINDDKEKRPDASKFLDHFKNLRQQEQL